MSESLFRVPVSSFNIGGRQGRFFMSESLFRVPVSWFNIGGHQGRFLCQNLYSESL